MNVATSTWLELYLAWNLVAFCLVGSDKQRAINNRWRIRERNFFIMALFFGAAGVFLGMHYYRHKTRHNAFVIGIPLLFLLNLAFIYFVC